MIIPREVAKVIIKSVPDLCSGVNIKINTKTKITRAIIERTRKIVALFFDEIHFGAATNPKNIHNIAKSR